MNHDAFFLGVDDDIHKLFPRLARHSRNSDCVSDTAPYSYVNKSPAESSQIESNLEDAYMTGLSIDDDPAPFFNDLDPSTSFTVSTSRQPRSKSLKVKKSGSKPSKVSHHAPSKSIENLHQSAGLVSITSDPGKDANLPMIHYGCPNPRWPSKISGYDPYTSAHLVYNVFVTKGDDSADTKFHTRCNELLATDLLSRDISLIKRAVRWIQWEFQPPPYARKMESLLGESLMWSIVYDIAGQHFFDIGDVTKALAQVIDSKVAADLQSGSIREKTWHLKQIDSLVCKKIDEIYKGQ